MATTEIPQHMQALNRANEVRLARTRLKREVRRGEVSAADVIFDPPPEAVSMMIGDLLSSQLHWGARRTARFLAQHGLPERKLLGTLTARQRRVVAVALGGRPAWPSAVS